MPPAMPSFSREKSRCEKPGWSSSALYSVFTPEMNVNRQCLSSAMNAGMSRGFVISTLRPPCLKNVRQLQVRQKMW